MTADLTIYAETINHAWNSHDSEKVLGFYSSEYVGSDVGQPSVLYGHDGLRATLDLYWTAFPDLQFAVTETVVEGSRVAAVWVAAGTHKGPIMKIPPSGRRVEVRGVSIIEVRDGLVVRGQYIWDLAGMLRHIGLLPEL